MKKPYYMGRGKEEGMTSYSFCKKGLVGNERFQAIGFVESRFQIRFEL
jgi:hypothetical protein